MSKETNEKNVYYARITVDDNKTNPWAPMYDRMADETCKNEKERIAAGKLRAGASLEDSRITSGLSEEEFNDLLKRLSHWENTNMTTGNIT